ncbi:MAG TPA: S53 family peptidase [Dictyobacter sp.]|jgi:subtilase family serine protease|nr:S53 family peptidase [Dictyobacter sp.]
MTRLPRLIVLLLIVLPLFASCSATPGNTIKTTANKVTPVTTSTTATSCPTKLKLPPTCLTPQALRDIYGFTPLIQKGYTGQGQTIIDIVSYGSPTLQKDMDLYDRTFGLPPINLQTIAPLTDIPETDPHHDKAGWAAETTLDVQIIHSLAPAAKIIVLASPVDEVEGTTGLPEFLQLEQYAINHKLGNIISHSWGASEITLNTSAGRAEMQQWNTLLQQGTVNDHITYVASSGDQGATDYADINATKLATVPTTNFIADSPWVTSVGGTSVHQNKNTVSESAWPSSGGGFSRFYATPDYQQSLPQAVQTELHNRRGVPDVAADADPLTGLAMVMGNSWTLAGGTSASAPVWAALAAIANQMAGHPLGFINPGLYALANSPGYEQDFHDVTQGNNTNGEVKGYPAVKGWDPVTGLGTPDAQYLIPNLILALK